MSCWQMHLLMQIRIWKCMWNSNSKTFITRQNMLLVMESFDFAIHTVTQNKVKWSIWNQGYQFLLLMDLSHSQNNFQFLITEILPASDNNFHISGKILLMIIVTLYSAYWHNVNDNNGCIFVLDNLAGA